jgi:forespore regulator of the sigma-K checkpoint
MNIYSFITLLKEKKGTFFLSGLFVLVGILYVIGLNTVTDVNAEKRLGQSIEVQEAHPVTGPLTLEVHLRRIYLDGDESLEIVEETIWSMEDFWAQYEDWQLVDQGEQRILFVKEVNDISPVLKMNGYFGITKGGVLTIFEGSPDNQEVIQSFFQIDVKKVESYLQEQLEDGIPVKSKENYETVLKEFQQYTSQ